MKTRFLALGAAALLWSSLGAFAIAEPSPSPSAAPHGVTIPPEVQNNPYVQSVLNALGGLLQTTNGNTANGKVTFFRRFDMQVETAPNVFRSVHLHQGTIINPRGTTLSPGMLVNVSGSAQHDGSLNADSISVR
jgi:hypothetical protein